VTTDISRPENTRVSSGPSDASGIADAIRETSSPNRKGNGGIATGSYSATTSGLMAEGFSRDGTSTTTFEPAQSIFSSGNALSVTGAYFPGGDLSQLAPFFCPTLLHNHTMPAAPLQLHVGLANSMICRLTCGIPVFPPFGLTSSDPNWQQPHTRSPCTGMRSR
jgi:hypothetical protein